MKNWTQFIKKQSFEQINLLSGYLSFFLVLSIIPIITLLGTIASFLDISVAKLIIFMQESIPLEISNLLIPFLNGNNLDLQLSIFMIIVFITAANGPYAMIQAANKLYNGEKLNFKKGRLKAFILTLLMVFLILLLLLVLAFGDLIMDFILNVAFIKIYETWVTTAFSIGKWPVALGIMYFIIKLIYYLLAPTKEQRKELEKGTIFTTIGWSIITVLYSYYVSSIASYDIFYGSLSNLIILMLWFYLLSLILLIGILINVYSLEMRKNTSVKIVDK